MAAPPSRLKSWFDQAWADWIQPLGGIIVVAIAYVLYRFGVLSELVAGTLLTLAVVIGTLAAGVFPAVKQTRTSSQRAMLLSLTLLALIGAAWPPLHLALAPRLAVAHLTQNAPSATMTTGSDGPYELVVSGRFRPGSPTDVEASYTVKVEGVGSAEISGTLKRATHRYRTSRRGGSTASTEERTELVHRVDGVRGGTLKLTSEGLDEQLDGAIDVGLRSAGPRPEIFWALASLAVLLGLILDMRLGTDIPEGDRKVRGPKREHTYLGVVTGILLVYAINLPMEATPHALVAPGIGAFVLALLVGGSGGWLVAGFLRLAARPKRRA